MKKMEVFSDEVLYTILKDSVIDDDVLTISKDIEVLDARIARIVQSSNIKHIKFSEGSKLKKIQIGLFANATNLESVDFSNCENLEIIEDNSFENCANLNTVNLSNCKNLKILGDSAFRKCRNLKKLTFKGCDSLEEMQTACFEFSTSLENVDLSSLPALKDIGTYCFGHSGLKRLDLSNCNVELLNGRAFIASENLEEVNLSGSAVKNIRVACFAGCKKLKKVNLSNCENLKVIDGVVFADCPNIELIDVRNSSNLNMWYSTGAEGYKIKADKVLLDYNYKSKRTDLKCNPKFSTLFDENCNVEIWENGKQLFAFKGNDEVYADYKVLSLGLLKFARKKGFDINAQFLNSFVMEEELNIAFKNFKALNVLVNGKMLNGGALSYIGESLKLLRVLGYFGLVIEGNKDVKGDLEIYKNLLAKDLINKKIKQEIRSDTNKDYINKLIQEKTNKIARSYSLDKLITLWVENNVVNHPLKEKLLNEMFLLNDKEVTNLKFAQFFVANFDEIMDKKISQIGEVNREIAVNEDFVKESINGKIRLSAIYKNFDEILEKSNKKVVTRSNNQRLTLDDCEFAKTFENVLEGNEELAELCGNARMDQAGFKFLQDVFEKGKKVKDNQILLLCQDESESEITYEFINKDNPIGLVLGNITNCCQRYKGQGEDCMLIGATEPTSAFVALKYKGEIIGQSWVWYHEKERAIVLDNIEVPDVYLKLVNKEKTQEVIDCIKRLSDNFYLTMKSNGHYIDRIVIGKHCTDIDALKDEFHFVYDKKECIHSPFKINGKPCYSDASEDGQYLTYNGGKPSTKELELEKLRSAGYKDFIDTL